jgi:hypothetical protein
MRCYSLSGWLINVYRKQRISLNTLPFSVKFSKTSQKPWSPDAKLRLFRQNAFDTSLKILVNLKRIFNEIEATLEKATGCDDPLDSTLHIPTGHNIL